MADVHADFEKSTLAFWQPRAMRMLDGEDVRQIVENTAGFFSVLQQWQAESKGNANDNIP